MSRYIDADALLADLDKFAEDKKWRSKRTLRERWLRNQGIEIFRMGVKAFPTADVIDRKIHEAVCKQIMWTRDIAIGQLKEIGKSFGEKMDDVEPVVHGRWDEDHKCTHCGADAVHHDIDDETVVYYPTRYCPNCGAKMDGEVQDEISKKTCCN